MTYTFYPVEYQENLERERERQKQEEERQQREREREIWVGFVMTYDKPTKPPKRLKKDVDIRGQKFGKLVVVGRVTGEATYCDGHRWRCRCICGGAREAWAVALLRGIVSDCGCRKRWAKRRQRSRRKKERLASRCVKLTVDKSG
jgi:hypothetical protein